MNIEKGTFLEIKCIARANCSAFNNPAFFVSQSSLQTKSKEKHEDRVPEKCLQTQIYL